MSRFPTYGTSISGTGSRGVGLPVLWKGTETLQKQIKIETRGRDTPSSKGKVEVPMTLLQPVSFLPSRPGPTSIVDLTTDYDHYRVFWERGKMSKRGSSDRVYGLKGGKYVNRDPERQNGPGMTEEGGHRTGLPVCSFRSRRHLSVEFCNPLFTSFLRFEGSGLIEETWSQSRTTLTSVVGAPPTVHRGRMSRH